MVRWEKPGPPVAPTIMSAGVLLVGLSCLCFAFADRFLLYCAAAALTGVGYSSGPGRRR